MLKINSKKEEKNRIKSLHSLSILDTPAAERFDRLTRIAKRMFNVPIAHVSLISEDCNWCKPCIDQHICKTPEEVSFYRHSNNDNEISIISDISKNDRFLPNPLIIEKRNIQFYAGCPLKYTDGSTLGTLCIFDDKPREFSDEDIESLKDLAGLAEREIVAVQLATMDELTQISNRRGFITIAQNSLNVCDRQAGTASLVFLDLNDFKPINDKFGHAEGDRALITFANHMKKVFRNSDVYARIGGDEFVVLLTNTSDDPAEEIVARFRQSLEHYNHATRRGYDLSFCEGIVTVDCSQNSSIEDLLIQADNLMYEKKHERSADNNRQ